LYEAPKGNPEAPDYCRCRRSGNYRSRLFCGTLLHRGEGMSEYVYAADEDCELWICEDEREALEDIFSLGNMDLGESEVTIYRGEKKPVSVEKFIPDVCDLMIENSSDSMPCDFPWEIPYEKRQQLQDLVEKTILDFVKANNLSPSCFFVTNIVPIKIRVHCTDDSWVRVTA
jgi:hypothetical protein